MRMALSSQPSLQKWNPEGLYPLGTILEATRSKDSRSVQIASRWMFTYTLSYLGHDYLSHVSPTPIRAASGDLFMFAVPRALLVGGLYRLCGHMLAPGHCSFILSAFHTVRSPHAP